MTIKPVQQGKVSVFYKYGAEAVGGTVVCIDVNNDDYVALYESGGSTPYGLLAQDVVAEDYQEWKLDSITQRARVSSNVGIYYGGGTYVLNSDSYTGNVLRGDNLYPNDAGVLGTSNAINGKMSPVALAETSGNAGSGNSIRIKLLI